MGEDTVDTATDEESRMKFNRKWFGTGLAAVALAAVGIGGAALATSDSPEVAEHAEVDDETGENDTAEDEAEGEDTPISDQDALARASEAALSWLESEHGASGEVSDTEVGDEESYYEIEVTLEDGRQVDVQLDEDFNVVGLD